MAEAATELVSMREGDATEFVEIVRRIALGVAHESKPKRLYLIRIDTWFGPKWLHFAGKFSVGGYVGRRMGIGVHKKRLHVPPFVPARVVSERVFAGPNLSETAVVKPLHIDCPSKVALQRLIEDIDEDAAFLWFSGESESLKRGAVMVYLPVESKVSGFYAGFAEANGSWEPAMLRHISRGELDGLRTVDMADVSGLQPLEALRGSAPGPSA